MDNSPCLYENFISKYENLYERVNTSFIKRASNAILVYSEHWPGVSLSQHSWASYWIRLCDGPNNVLLNKCFQLSVNEKPQWIHCIIFFVNIKWTWIYLVRSMNDLWLVSQTLSTSHERPIYAGLEEVHNDTICHKEYPVEWMCSSYLH